MTWHIAPALVVLRDEVNARWPNRSKLSDGFIGDAAHAATASDHNPNIEGAVCAFDITHDPVSGPDIAVLFDRLRANPHPTCKYLIANGQIASRLHDWTIRPYTGDPHINHLHASVGVGSDGQSAPGTYNDTSPWPIDTVQEDDMLTADESNKLSRAFEMSSWLAGSNPETGAPTGGGVPHIEKLVIALCKKAGIDPNNP